MKQSLNGKWRVRGYYPNVPMSDWAVYHEFTDEIDATVPGGIHLDLYSAGWIENPYAEQNSLGCEWTENRWWIYRTTVDFSPECGARRELVFEGLDYLAEIIINGVSYGEHENMFVPMRIDLSHIKERTLAIEVILKGAVSELGQNGRTSETRTQKSRFGYKWDFGTRLVNIGIWQDVYLEYIDSARIAEVAIDTDALDGRGWICATLDFEGRYDGAVELALDSPDGVRVCTRCVPFAQRLTERFEIDAPALWYPNGMGAQPLYTLSVSYGEESYEYKVGVRRLRYRGNPGAPEDAIPYTLEINGKPVYVKGNNKVPLDHLYGNVSREDYEWCVRAMVNENVNLVRVWGGGIIETEVFYDLCDRYGILIWQDFIQSSSGLDHVPSKHADFLKKLSDAATHAVKTKRRHVSLAVWTGGNELTDEACLPATYADENIAMLKRIVETHDPARLFLPTTPSGPVYTTVFTREDNHDVHSPWEYDPSTHYANYNRLKLLLHSEFGVSAMSSSIPLFMKENRPDAARRGANHHHGEAWWHSYRRDKAIYGEFDDPSEYVLYSQWTQAEALRYVIETERRMAPYASGSMVWQINEPWPNCDCSNLMDYFGTPKMGYYWVKKAFSESEVSLRYDGICLKNGFRATVSRNGDACAAGESCRVRVFDVNGACLLENEFSVDSLPQTLAYDWGDERMLMVRLTHRGIDKDYFFSADEVTPYRAARDFARTELSCRVEWKGNDGALQTATVYVKNEGEAPAYFVHLADACMEHALLCDDAYFTLLPGESRAVAVCLRKNCGIFFEKGVRDAQIVAKALNAST